MRIIAGTRKGMNLFSPVGRQTRPITDRAKESLFDVLFNYDILDGAIVADLFCGTGSLGLEALSRGAGRATFIDSDRSALDLLQRNIDKARFTAESHIIRANAFKTGAPPSPADATPTKYDIVFVDPPYKATYDTGMESQLGRLLIVLNEQVRPGGLVIVRTEEHANLLDSYGQLRAIDRRRWGSMAVTILQMTGGQA